MASFLDDPDNEGATQNCGQSDGLIFQTHPLTGWRAKIEDSPMASFFGCTHQREISQN